MKPPSVLRAGGRQDGVVGRDPQLPAEEKLGGRAHHLWAPHRIEGQLRVNRLDTFYRERLRLDLLLDEVSHRAHRTRQTEGDVHVPPLIVDPDVVDQAKLHEIHPNLRIYHVPELVPHALLGYHSLTSCWGVFTTPIVKLPKRFST